jgi:hypothetical protein
MRGRTRGMYECEASFTIAKEDFELIKSALASMGLGGFMEAEFLVNVIYRELGSELITDAVEGCRIKHVENSHSAGNADALVAKVDLSPFRIRWNGVYGVSAVAGGLPDIGGLLP